MNHLTDEQFEQIINGAESAPEHIADCDLCKARLAEKQALAQRLRTAFQNVEPSSSLAGRIHNQIDQSSEKPHLNILDTRAHWKGWTAVLSAVAAVIILAPVLVNILSPSSANTAQAALVRIHEHNLSADHEFHSQAEPEKLAEYFKDKLGFNPRLPKLDQGMALRGCCVIHFQGQIVGSYVVDTSDGVMSIIVVTDSPESLGIAEKFTLAGQTYWKSTFAKCDMVSVRIGDYTYCAVGEISYKYLTDLLTRLVPSQQQ